MSRSKKVKDFSARNGMSYQAAHHALKAAPEGTPSQATYKGEIQPITYIVEPSPQGFWVRTDWGLASMVSGSWATEVQAKKAVEVLEQHGEAGGLYFAKVRAVEGPPPGVETVFSIHGVKLSCFGSVITGINAPVKGGDLVNALTERFGNVDCSAPGSVADIRPVSNGWQVYLRGRRHPATKMWVFSPFPTLIEARAFWSRLKDAVNESDPRGVPKGLDVDILWSHHGLRVQVASLPEASNIFDGDFSEALDYAMALRGARFPEQPAIQPEEIIIPLTAPPR